MKTETIQIKKIVNGGYGLTHLSSGQVVFVQHVLPGETMVINTEEGKKNHLFGKIQQILTEHSGRITPPCKYYHHCGGCDLQHCNYDTQLSIKRGIIEDLLCRQSSKAVRESLLHLTAPLPSPVTFGYRQRIRLQVGNRGVVGFRRFHSHDIIPINFCLLAGNEINRSLTALLENVHGQNLCELSTEVELQLNPQTGKTVCLFHFSRKVRPADARSAQLFCGDVPEVERIFFIGKDFPISAPYFTSAPKDHKKMDNMFVVHYATSPQADGPISFCWEAGGFCQVNLAQNKNLIKIVLEFSRVDTTTTVLDLFCGMGNFSIPLAGEAKEVFGIEGQGSAIRSAKKNALNAKLTNTRFLKSPVHSACMELAQNGQKFDCVLIDPPRQGVPELADQLAKITRKRLVYISCDPATLCRDLTKLTDEGFSIRKIQPVDMFPQTHHIETVVLLEKGCKLD